jgi:hypothetical protein
VAAVLVTGVAARAYAGEVFQTVKDNTFVCVSPQAYDDAMVRVAQLNGKSIDQLKQELAEQKQCMFVDPEMAEDIMAPFAVVLERDGNKVKIQFVVTQRKKIEFLHRMINRYVLVGWTEIANLTPKAIL